MPADAGSSETAILYSSNEKQFKLINYLVSNKYVGAWEGKSLVKTILLQSKLHHSQSCDNYQMIIVQISISSLKGRE